MTNNKKTYDNQEVIDQLLFLYKDYENKIIQHFPIMDCVRDLYYLENTSLTYDDWLEAKQNS